MSRNNGKAQVWVNDIMDRRFTKDCNRFFP